MIGDASEYALEIPSWCADDASSNFIGESARPNTFAWSDGKGRPAGAEAGREGTSVASLLLDLGRNIAGPG